VGTLMISAQDSSAFPIQNLLKSVDFHNLFKKNKNTTKWGVFGTCLCYYKKTYDVLPKSYSY